MISFFILRCSKERHVHTYTDWGEVRLGDYRSQQERKVGLALVESQNAHKKPGWIDLKRRSRNSSQVSHSGGRNPSPWTTILGTLASVWIRSGTSRTQLHLNMGCRSCKYWLNLLCHNAHSKVIFFWTSEALSLISLSHTHTKKNIKVEGRHFKNLSQRLALQYSKLRLGHWHPIWALIVSLLFHSWLSSLF